MAQYSHATYIHGGVGAPVGLTVFKTAEGSLGAVPGGFDSHTPLPLTFRALFVPSGVTLEKPQKSAVTLENILKEIGNVRF